MTALTERDIESITNAIDLKVRDRLDEHRKEMKVASKEARNAAVEALTGEPWENRAKVRAAVQWAHERKESNSRRRVAFWGAITILAANQFWDTLTGAFHK